MKIFGVENQRTEDNAKKNYYKTHGISGFIQTLEEHGERVFIGLRFRLL